MAEAEFLEESFGGFLPARVKNKTSASCSLIWGMFVSLIIQANNSLQPCLLGILEQRPTGTFPCRAEIGQCWCLKAECRIKSCFKKQAIKVALRKLVTLLNGWVH